jgi:hypothetical protein
MNVSAKQINAQLYRLLLYKRPLHPELLDLRVRRIDRHGPYEIESWLTAGGHAVRFAAKSQSLVELVVENGEHLPETGLVHALPCLGEKDFELDPEGDIGYVTTIQTETLSENLFLATYQEMEEFVHETGSLSHEWQDDGAKNLSVLDAQKYKREYHIQSYHLLSRSGLVLRTQSIFEILE